MNTINVTIPQEHDIKSNLESKSLKGKLESPIIKNPLSIKSKGEISL